MHLNLKHVFLLHFTTIAMPCTQERERMHSELLTIKKLVESKLGGEYFGLRSRSEEHTSELQSHLNLVCRLLLEKKKKKLLLKQYILNRTHDKIDHMMLCS